MGNNQVQLYTVLHRLERQMHRLSHSIDKRRNHYYREESRLLFLISQDDGIIQRDLAEKMDVRPSSMTEMIEKMERLGLVVRRQDEKDQRVMHIFLTDKGMSEVDESKSDTERLTDVLFKSLSDEEVEQMLKLTSKICDDLDTITLNEHMNDLHGHHRGLERELNHRHRHHWI